LNADATSHADNNMQANIARTAGRMKHNEWLSTGPTSLQTRLRASLPPFRSLYTLSH